jgi:hypothetical protein
MLAKWRIRRKFDPTNVNVSIILRFLFLFDKKENIYVAWNHNIAFIVGCQKAMFKITEKYFLSIVRILLLLLHVDSNQSMLIRSLSPLSTMKMTNRNPIRNIIRHYINIAHTNIANPNISTLKANKMFADFIKLCQHKIIKRRNEL